MYIDSTRAPHGATTFTNKDDAAIIAAWQRRAAAYVVLDEAVGDSADEQWAIIDAAEHVIQAATATTPSGAETQLWVAFDYHFTDAKSGAAAKARDLDWFIENSDDLDWVDRIFVAAVRSLREQGK